MQTMKRRTYGAALLGLALAVTSVVGLGNGVLARPADPAAPVNPVSKISRDVLAATANGGQASVVLLLADQADLSKAFTMKDSDARGWYVYNTLTEHAKTTQAALQAELTKEGRPFQSYWAANMIITTGDRTALLNLAARPDIKVIESNAPSRWIEDPAIADAQPAPSSPNTTEWGVNNINAPSVWAMGYTGQGIVIANQDTGMQWDHPALKPHYRGWNGTTADHNYNWYDAIRSGSGSSCGYALAAPCDDLGHGTHTTGTTVGDDGSGNQIGVAPGAKWIGCRNMDQGNGTPATYTTCFQFFMAPTDLNGNNADPTKRPDVMNNSWGCPTSEGCAATTLQTIVHSTVAAGIFVEASAGNSGSACSTVTDPPALYADAFTTAAYDSSNTLAGFSSRGPVTVDGSSRRKPDIGGPGVSVRSSIPGNGYANYNGTSMAGPHVVGTVALLWSARPQLRRDIAGTIAALENTANPSIAVTTGSTSCGGIAYTIIPNNHFGYGRVDALAAVNSVPVATATVTSTPPTATATQTAVPPTVTQTTVPPTSTSTTTTAPATGTTTPEPPTVTSTATVTHTPCPITFNDVQATDYFYTPVLYLACRGVVSGYSDGTYRPYNNTTRGQLAKIVVGAFSLPITTPAAGGNTFADVPVGSTFFPYIETAAAHSIVSGYPCGGVNPQTGAQETCDANQRPYYRPSNFVTRGQLTKIVVGAAQQIAGWTLINPATPTFSDVPPGSTFYQYIETAVCHQVLNGYNDGTFQPGNNAFRGQIAKIVYNAVNDTSNCPTGGAR